MTSITLITGNHDHYGGHPEAQIEYYNQKVDPDGRWVMPGAYCICLWTVSLKSPP